MDSCHHPRPCSSKIYPHFALASTTRRLDATKPPPLKIGILPSRVWPSPNLIPFAPSIASPLPVIKACGRAILSNKVRSIRAHGDSAQHGLSPELTHRLDLFGHVLTSLHFSKASYGQSLSSTLTLKQDLPSPCSRFDHAAP